MNKTTKLALSILGATTLTTGAGIGIGYAIPRQVEVKEPEMPF
jgi:hypothetical protein